MKESCCSKPFQIKAPHLWSLHSWPCQWPLDSWNAWQLSQRWPCRNQAGYLAPCRAADPSSVWWDANFSSSFWLLKKKVSRKNHDTSSGWLLRPKRPSFYQSFCPSCPGNTNEVSSIARHTTGLKDKEILHFWLGLSYPSSCQWQFQSLLCDSYWERAKASGC